MKNCDVCRSLANGWAIEGTLFKGKIIEIGLNNSAYFPLIFAVLGAFWCVSVRVVAS